MNQQLCYHESLQHLHVNTLPNHAYFIPHASRETALTGDRTQSGRLTLLNGQWCFRYFDSVLDVPEDVFTPGLTNDTIPVPAVWQNHGYEPVEAE
jgi:beta-galactosidase